MESGETGTFDLELDFKEGTLQELQSEAVVIKDGYVTGLGPIDSKKGLKTEIKEGDRVIVVIKSTNALPNAYNLKVEFERPEDMTLFFLLIGSLILGIVTLTCMFCCIVCIHRSRKQSKEEKSK